MSEQLYLLHCSHCGNKKLTDGSGLSGLVEVKTCKDCGGARRFKCPKCGYLMKVGKANTSTKTESQKHIEKIREKEKLRRESIEKERTRRLKEKRKQDEKD